METTKITMAELQAFYKVAEATISKLAELTGLSEADYEATTTEAQRERYSDLAQYVRELKDLTDGDFETVLNLYDIY